MKKFLAISLCVLVCACVNAQSTAEKYFTDSVSFAYKSCNSYKEKRKEISQCVEHTFKAAASYSDFSVYEDAHDITTDKPDRYFHGYIKGQLGSIDFYKSKIELWDGGNNAVPDSIYMLTLQVKSDKPWLTVKPIYFNETTQYYAYLYFATEADAIAAKDYLKQRAEIGGY